MKYRGVAFRSASLCRVCDVRELRNKPMYFGPWKMLRTAKKKATELRKERAVYSVQGGPFIDYGPMCSRVYIEEVPE